MSFSRASSPRVLGIIGALTGLSCGGRSSAVVSGGVADVGDSGNGAADAARHEDANGAADAGPTGADDAGCQSPPLPLVTGQGATYAIAVAGGYLYWVRPRDDSGRPNPPSPGIFRIPVQGGEPQLVHAADRPEGLALFEANIYFSDWTGSPNGGVGFKKGDVTGQAATEIVYYAIFDDPSPRFAVDSTNLYWGDQESGEVVERSLDGMTNTVLFSSQLQPSSSGISAVVADANNVYFSFEDQQNGNGKIMAASISGDLVAALTDPITPPRGIALGDSSVYWTDGASVSKVPTAGGPPIELAAVSGAPDGSDGAWIALDATDVFWTHTTTGEVWKVARGGGESVELASNQASPAGIAVDDSYVYWANSGDGSIMRAGKCMGAPAPANQCAVPSNAPEGGLPFHDVCPAGGCPEGTVCVVEIGGIAGGGGEYCAPIPASCNGVPTCACMRDCVCTNRFGADGGVPESCTEEPGHPTIDCDDGIR